MQDVSPQRLRKLQRRSRGAASGYDDVLEIGY